MIWEISAIHDNLNNFIVSVSITVYSVQVCICIHVASLAAQYCMYKFDIYRLPTDFRRLETRQFIYSTSAAKCCLLGKFR